MNQAHTPPSSADTSKGDIQSQLSTLFFEHPSSTSSPDDPSTPIVPAKAILPILSSFCTRNGITLLDEAEKRQLDAVASANPDLEITPESMMDLISRLAASREEGDDSLDSILSPSSDPTRDVETSSEGSTVVSSPTAEREASAGDMDSSFPSDPLHNPFIEQESPLEHRMRAAALERRLPSTWDPRPQAASRNKKTTAEWHPSGDNNPRKNRSRTPSNPLAMRSQSPSSPIKRFRESLSNPGTPTRGPTPSFSGPSRAKSRSAALSASDLIDSSPLLVPKRPSIGNLSTSSSEDLESSPGRSPSSSPPSHVQIEALQRTNAELSRELQNSERILQQKLNDHEYELEDLQGKLEDLRKELYFSRKEEKELRNKERALTNQLANVEAEMNKLQRLLENSRAAYHTIHKQYQATYAESEKYRDQLRQREQDLKHMEEAAILHQSDSAKWKAQRESAEETVEFLEQELANARQAERELEDQRHDNLALKDTIDRLRLELDDMRSSGYHTSSTPASGAGKSGRSSLQGTFSRSLANELRSRLTDALGEEDGDDAEGDDQVAAWVRDSGEESSQTALPSPRGEPSIQYPPPLGSSIGVQTDTAELEGGNSSRRRDKRPLRLEEDYELSTTDEGDFSLSTIASMPSLPTSTSSPPPSDSPPSYSHVQQSSARKRRQEVIKRWYPGLRHFSGAGLTSQAVMDFNNLKREVGFECIAIERVMQASGMRDTEGRIEEIDGVEEESEGSVVARDSRRKRYNIYNTYLYRNPSIPEDDGPSPQWNVALVGLFGFSMWSLGVLTSSALSSDDSTSESVVSSAAVNMLMETIARVHARRGIRLTGNNHIETAWMVAQHLVLGAANAVRRINQ